MIFIVEHRISLRVAGFVGHEVNPRIMVFLIHTDTRDFEPETADGVCRRVGYGRHDLICCERRTVEQQIIHLFLEAHLHELL